jgi:hypothetical protein
LKKIHIDTIRLDGETQSRAELNTQKIDEYADLMKEGTAFKPITVFHDGKDYWLAAGFHRYFAQKKNKITAIDADVREGTVDDALIFSLGSNKDHGIQTTTEDNRYAVSIIKKRWPTWTNTMIAKHIGVSSMTVGRLIKSLSDGTEEEPQEKVYERKGKQVKVSASKLKREKPTKEKKVEPKEPEDDRVSELSHTITSLDEENKRLRDTIASHKWDASEIEIEDIHDTVKDLREQIRVLEIDNAALRDSRDMFQERNAELLRTITSLKKKLK